MPTQQAYGAKAKSLAGRRQCMQMIGVSPTQADDAFGAGLCSNVEVFDQLEPFVATDQRIDLVQTQDRDFDAGCGQPVEVEALERGFREPVARGEMHRCRFWVKSQHSSRSKAAIASRLAMAMGRLNLQITTQPPTANPD